MVVDEDVESVTRQMGRSDLAVVNAQPLEESGIQIHVMQRIIYSQSWKRILNSTDTRIGTRLCLGNPSTGNLNREMMVQGQNLNGEMGVPNRT